MSREIILVHGFNVKDGGEHTTDKLKPFFEDYDIREADYGWLGFLGVRYANQHLARVVAGMAADGAIGIGHSNGCDILRRASFMTPKLRRLILINPALDSDSAFPEWVKRIDVFHNEGDVATWMAKFLPWHSWGDMGKVGYTGDDPKVFNHDETDLFGAEGHCGVFAEENIQSFGHAVRWLVKSYEEA